jgi:hypothetical protein
MPSEFDPRKIRERRRIAKLARQARPRAFQDARDLCGAVGPERIAEEYEVPAGSTAAKIAAVYAEASYRKQARKAAEEGALAGFEDFERGD